jgi:hypothetical protein
MPGYFRRVSFTPSNKLGIFDYYRAELTPLGEKIKYIAASASSGNSRANVNCDKYGDGAFASLYSALTSKYGKDQYGRRYKDSEYTKFVSYSFKSDGRYVDLFCKESLKKPLNSNLILKYGDYDLIDEGESEGKKIKDEYNKNKFNKYGI